MPKRDTNPGGWPNYPPNGVEMDVSHDAHRAMQRMGVRWETAMRLDTGDWRCHGLVAGPAYLYASEVERQRIELEEFEERHRGEEA